MKVAHLIVGGEIAGGQIICRRIIHELKQRGDNALVVSPNEGEFTRTISQEAVPVFFIPFEKTYHFKNAVEFSKLLKEQNVDLVHTHGMVSSNVQARIGARIAGVPVLSHIHISNYFRDNPWIQIYQKSFDNLTAYLCDEIITISNSTKQDLILQGNPRGRISVIHNGIDADQCRVSKKRDDVLKEFGLNASVRLIGTVGRLCPVKGQREFIWAAREITAQFPDIRFIIVGKDIEAGGMYEQALKELADQLGLADKIIFTGFRSDVYDLMNAFEFFVLPSRNEGLPVTILEAMALKKAVVASRVGGVSEIVIDGETGYVVPPNNVPVLVRALTNMIQHPEKTKQMGEAGYKRVKEHFSEKQMIHQIFNTYERILSKRATKK